MKQLAYSQLVTKKKDPHGLWKYIQSAVNPKP